MNYKHLIAFAAVIACTFAAEADVKDLTDNDFEAGVTEVRFLLHLPHFSFNFPQLVT